MSYLAIAEAAAAYARNKLFLGASNVGVPTRATAARVSDARAFLLDGLPDVNGYDTVLRAARGAIANSAGNCGEHAAVAYLYLFQRQVFPLDYVSYIHYDHAWIVVGRPAGTDIRRPEEWGGNPLVIDPWAGLSGAPMVVTIADYEQRYETFDIRGSARVDRTAATESPF